MYENSLLFQSDFDADLTVRGSFPSFFVLYQLMYKSRIILEDTDYSTYSGYLPDWLYYWSALSTKPPLPGFYNLPAGRTKKTWGMNNSVNKSVGGEGREMCQLDGNHVAQGYKMK